MCLLMVLSSLAVFAAPNSKVLICHATGSSTNPFVELHISESAVSNHLANNPNDYVGSCGSGGGSSVAFDPTRITPVAPMVTQFYLESNTGHWFIAASQSEWTTLAATLASAGEQLSLRTYAFASLPILEVTPYTSLTIIESSSTGIHVTGTVSPTFVNYVNSNVNVNTKVAVGSATANLGDATFTGNGKSPIGIVPGGPGASGSSGGLICNANMPEILVPGTTVSSTCTGDILSSDTVNCVFMPWERVGTGVDAKVRAVATLTPVSGGFDVNCVVPTEFEFPLGPIGPIELKIENTRTKQESQAGVGSSPNPNPVGNPNSANPNKPVVTKTHENGAVITEGEWKAEGVVKPSRAEITPGPGQYITPGSLKFQDTAVSPFMTLDLTSVPPGISCTMSPDLAAFACENTAPITGPIAVEYDTILDVEGYCDAVGDVVEDNFEAQFKNKLRVGDEEAETNFRVPCYPKVSVEKRSFGGNGAGYGSWPITIKNEDSARLQVKFEENIPPGTEFRQLTLDDLAAQGWVCTQSASTVIAGGTKLTCTKVMEHGESYNGQIVIQVNTADACATTMRNVLDVSAKRETDVANPYGDEFTERVDMSTPTFPDDCGYQHPSGVFVSKGNGYLNSDGSAISFNLRFKNVQNKEQFVIFEEKLPPGLHDDDLASLVVKVQAQWPGAVCAIATVSSPEGDRLLLTCTGYLKALESKEIQITTPIHDIAGVCSGVPNELTYSVNGGDQYTTTSPVELFEEQCTRVERSPESWNNAEIEVTPGAEGYLDIDYSDDIYLNDDDIDFEEGVEEIELEFDYPDDYMFVPGSDMIPGGWDCDDSEIGKLTCSPTPSAVPGPMSFRFVTQFDYASWCGVDLGNYKARVVQFKSTLFRWGQKVAEGSSEINFQFNCKDFTSGPSTSPEVCNDAIDNDLDSLVDCADITDCATNPFCAAPVEICDSGGDEDFDGFVNCFDSDCFSHPSCQFVGSDPSDCFQPCSPTSPVGTICGLGNPDATEGFCNSNGICECGAN